MRSGLLLACLHLLIILVAGGAVSGAAATQCTIDTADLMFGMVDTLSELDSSASADLSIWCDEVPENVTTVTVCGNLGPGSGSAVDDVRQMSGVAGSLAFALYADAARQVRWGHGSYLGLGDPLRLTLEVVDGAASAVVTVYGLVFGDQAVVVPGSYATTVSGTHAVFEYDEGTLASCSGNQSSQTSIEISADVLANCLIEAGDMDFGSVGAITGNLDAVADLAVVCTPGTSYSIAIDGGLAAALPHERLMRSGERSITYGLYQDPARSAPWGEQEYARAGLGSGGEQVISVYGRVPAQSVAVGNYSDTVVVTIAYD